MKKKLNSLIAVALCALATCFVLVGCSPVSGGKNAKMVGYWELVSGTSGGLEITEDDVKTMSEEGSQCILHLGDDGKATLDLFGDIEDAAWDMDKATVDFDDEDGILVLSGDSLTLSNRNDDDEKLVFKKGDDSLKEKIKKDRKSQEESNESADVASGNDAKTESVAIDPVVTIADDETATITATARVVDENGMAGIMFSITNNSEAKICMHMLDDSTVNGGTYENYFYGDVSPGETANEICAYDGLTSIDELKDIHAQLSVYDSKTFADIAIYDINIE